MRTTEERAQMMLDALKLYNPEIKSENDKINKDAIVKMLKDQDKITRHACVQQACLLYRAVDINAIGRGEVQQVIMNTKAV